MRLKHVKNAHEKVEKSSYVILNPKDYKGKYQELFKNNNPIYLEIGTGKGSFLIENAKKNPQINFIGIEKYDSVLVRAIEKIENETLNNIKFIRMDAREIEDVFDHEIDTIYLNFSDPWPKDKHSKRRLSSEEFLKKYDKVFKKEANIFQKTDNRHLFEFSLLSYLNHDYKIKDISLSLHEDNYEDNIMTEYEKKFKEKNMVIYYVHVQKDYF